jgi:hypothetical protein
MRKPVIHPHTELRFINEEIGYGVFATQLIPCGTITWTLCEFDRVFTPFQVAAMSAAYRDILANYSYIDAHGNFVLCWDLGRYVNHSCHPTSLGVGSDLEMAVRDVAPGEQLTSEYGTLNLTTSLPCRCGSHNCRGLIRGDDVLRYGRQWDTLVRRALPRIMAVPQPLWPFLKEQEALAAILHRKAKLPSHLTYYCRQTAASAPSDGVRRKGLWHLPLGYDLAENPGN